MSKTSGFAPGSFGCHEAMHMASFLASAVDSELVGHPTIEGNPRWLKMAGDVLDALTVLYQEIAAQHIPDGRRGRHINEAGEL